MPPDPVTALARKWCPSIDTLNRLACTDHAALKKEVEDSIAAAVREALEKASACQRHTQPVGKLPFDSMCSKCADAYARQQVEAAYREGAGLGKFRFTQMKAREAVEAFREQVVTIIQDHWVHGDQACLAAIKRDISVIP